MPAGVLPTTAPKCGAARLFLPAPGRRVQVGPQFVTRDASRLLDVQDARGRDSLPLRNGLRRDAADRFREGDISADNGFRALKGSFHRNKKAWLSVFRKRRRPQPGPMVKGALSFFFKFRLP